MPKPALNNRNNRLNVYGRVIAHDLFLNQGVSNNDSPTFANLYLTGDATISGNLYVEGNTAILNSNVIEFEDNIIIINSKETGNGVTLNQSGFEINRGSLENYRFVFRESDLTFRTGVVSNMQAITSREDNPLSNGIMVWNDTLKRIDSKTSINLPSITFQSTINSISSSTGSLLLSGGIGIKKDIFTDGKLYLGGNVYSKRCSIYTDTITNNLSINSSEEINLVPRTNITIPTNKAIILGDSNKYIKSTPSNNIDIGCDGDINFNLAFSKRLIIPNLSSIVFSTDNEKIFTDGFNNMVIRGSEDILLQPLTNKKVLLPVDIPIAFSNASQQIKANASNDLLINASNNITITSGRSVRIASTVPSTSITSGSLILTGGLGMSGNLNVGGDISINGNVTMSGSTTTINTDTLLIKDNLIVINNNPLPLADGGILVKRFNNGTSGSISYAGVFYKESTDEYTFASTSLDNSNVIINSYIPIRSHSIYLESTSENSLVTLGTINIGKDLFVGGSVLKIPTGDTQGRPSNPNSGYIRFNTQTQIFEGYGNNIWNSLVGGVVDTNGDTKILAENSPGSNDDNLRFFTNGNEIMRINSAGNISIGTTNPSSKLHVDGIITGQDINILNNGNTNTFSINGTDESVNTSTGALLVSGGVGINGKIHAHEAHLGNTVISGDLTVSGSTITLQSQTQIINDNLLVLNAGPDGLYDSGIMLNITSGSYAVMFYDSATGHFHFGHTTSDPGSSSIDIDYYLGLRGYHIDIMGSDNALGLGTGGSLNSLGGASIQKDMYIGGHLYINDTTESSSTGNGSLVINGGASINKSLFINGPVLKIPSGDTASRPSNSIRGSIRFNSETEQFEGFGAGDSWNLLGGLRDTNGDTKILAENSPGSNDDNLRFFTNGNEIMRINSSGNIGIGTSNPSGKLQIAADYTGGSGNQITVSGLSEPNKQLLIGYSTLLNYGSIQPINQGIGFTNLILCPEGGNVGIGTSNPTSKLHVNGDIFSSGEVTVLSDIRFKENIETIDNALDKVDKLRGVYYNRKLNDGTLSQRNIGIIADEVEKVLPEVVHMQNDIKSVAYSNIIGLLIQAIKELKQEVQELRN